MEITEEKGQRVKSYKENLVKNKRKKEETEEEEGKKEE